MVDPHNMPEADLIRVKEISEYIIKSMLKRSYPSVSIMHYFEKYTTNKKIDPQFMHALAMMEKGEILRLDKDEKIASNSAFVLIENGKAKMHHMIDDESKSPTFGQMFNDPYEGPKKRVHCFKHIMNSDENCEKCKLETNSMICMNHGNVLSKCEACLELSKNIKKGLTDKDAPEMVTEILKVYKAKYWSFGGPKN